MWRSAVTRRCRLMTASTHCSRRSIRKLTTKGTRVTGVEFTHGGKLMTIGATREVILSTGAINTPKILMQSGIGEAAQLRKFGIPVVADLPGVGKNFQDRSSPA